MNCTMSISPYNYMPCNSTRTCLWTVAHLFSSTFINVHFNVGLSVCLSISQLRNHTKKEVTMPLYHATWNLYCKQYAFDLHFFIWIKVKLHKVFAISECSWFHVRLLWFATCKNIKLVLYQLEFPKDRTSRCPFVPGQKDFLVPLSLCPGTRAGQNNFPKNRKRTF